ncbi:ADP-ribosylglycohydrolase family protein [Luteipulveratus sp. YIM 133132]|uniref:ADP-ribosylglycohydrolase family protein n=1 Tax=Luteipulveratus flavus TaxID=3031728 RepID=A0ABT6C888_9MICO|nr:MULTISPECIES: ADP-ribosylglycohydrolase family protein [unclassified Luteipulveratus]MDE9366446.1 ADP-ribosylglycohydrolase family protein [Luteipulveratus sp. YIM 133132]MDF8264279.1 ADP-ribosylglycohydrolase family protein [Luteipulveratus sp. YIM 133296]
MDVSATMLDRAHGALAGLAVGDALGMPTQAFTRAEIVKRFGVLQDLRSGPPDQPIAPSAPAGQVTDDTEQALLLADQLVTSGGHVDPVRWAQALDRWEQRMKGSGSLDLLGPSTRRAIERIRAGEDPRLAGLDGTTNGGAMRIAPVALAVPWSDGPEALVDRVVEACLPTHHTGTAIAGAAAVAAAVSCALDGCSYDDVVAAAITCARLGETRGRQHPGPSVAARLQWVLVDAPRYEPDRLEEWITAVVGTTVATAESVPAAFALLDVAIASPRDGLCRAARLGGDTDTIAAMLGAMTGATVGRSGLPDDWCTTVESVNGLSLDAVAAGLLQLREGNS